MNTREKDISGILTDLPSDHLFSDKQLLFFPKQVPSDFKFLVSFFLLNMMNPFNKHTKDGTLENN